ncbi:glycosyltransferase family 4 protein [Sporormia fimetaria CBS 119925]|uniref:Glycosyltransferase family 4 protein n=1 Tax=Sporormia fimetaria CBS 119925 TaxID=1340428 RepID=A0A6A6VIK3_9PLEO|nr:glycosyltransferase family 4 protein [Sporormia fimetaria CBS 119925]
MAAAAATQKSATLQVPRRPAMLRRKTRESFQAQTSIHRVRKNKEEGTIIGVHSLFLGIAVTTSDSGILEIGFATHDGTYSNDFAVWALTGHDSLSSSADARGEALAKHLVAEIQKYREKHLCKFLGCGVSGKLVDLAPQLPSKLWLELDIVPFVFRKEEPNHYVMKTRGGSMTVDEEADSMARTCLAHFGPNNQPRLTIGYRNEVEVDCSGSARLTSRKNYQDTVSNATWAATLKYARSLSEKRVRIAFFNSTPQGGGVALMRHALVRFLQRLQVDCRWYVPRPKPEVFRITKNNHNILQGVADPKLRLTEDQVGQLDSWCEQNAERYWAQGDGPLSHPSAGGAHIVIIDDPQMPKLVEIAKKEDPNRPVIFRSHIQVRGDLADKEGSPTSEVWNWVWERVKQADLFISHPVREFIPNNVDFDKVGYMPATTDWLDGLNKEMGHWDMQYYIREFEMERFKIRSKQLAYPVRPYIVQIARFDPAKGIPDVLASYAKFRRDYAKEMDIKDIPQLVIAGHGAIDDPDATIIYDQTLSLLEEEYPDVIEDVVVMRIGPTDQILNGLLSCAHVALQLSTREGFEVKVSEALHKGIPIIATKAGGIPLQVQDGKSGFLVEPGDSDAVAKHLYALFTDQQLYEEMSNYAHSHVSDEVSTVGNALCWLYLADRLYAGEKLKPRSRWINDMAREHAHHPYEDWETRLPRSDKLKLVHDSKSTDETNGIASVIDSDSNAAHVAVKVEEAA